MNVDGWRTKKIIGVIALAALALGVIGWTTSFLWNWLMPPLFGLGTITLWQALGLFVLGRILFGGFRGFSRHRHHRHRMHERWRRMTPQERETFSRGLTNSCRWRQRSDTPSQSTAAQG